MCFVCTNAFTHGFVCTVCSLADRVPDSVALPLLPAPLFRSHIHTLHHVCGLSRHCGAAALPVTHARTHTHTQKRLFARAFSESTLRVTHTHLIGRRSYLPTGIVRTQVGFFDIVALPLFQSFAQAFGEATPLLDAVKDNYSMWRDEAAAFSQGTQAGEKEKSTSGGK